MADKIHCVRKTLRLTPGEAEMLAAAAGRAGMCEAEYLRLLVSQRPNDYPEIRQLLRELINEVRRIGVNINQIAHNHNIGIHTPEDRNRMTAYMRKLYDALDRTVKTIGDY